MFIEQLLCTSQCSRYLRYYWGRDLCPQQASSLEADTEKNDWKSGVGEIFEVLNRMIKDGLILRSDLHRHLIEVRRLANLVFWDRVFHGKATT